MSKNEETKLNPVKSRPANIRFSENEYRQIVRDAIESGKSIPWLLRTAYFKKGISAPTFDVEKRNMVCKELAQIGNHLNLLTKAIHTQDLESIKTELRDALNDIRALKSFLGLEYGHR